MRTRSVGESLAGTATETRYWLLVECGGEWPRDAMDAPQLASRRPEIETWLAETAWLGLEAERLNFVGQRARVQLIRKPGDHAGDSAMYLCDSASATVWKLDRLQSIAELTEEQRVHDDLFLVCAHGKRDQCCAVFGIEFARALSAASGSGEVWLTSHLGGHRFAPTMVSFPCGYMLGNLEPSEAELVRQTHGFHDLDKVRGRVDLPADLQLADIELRRLKLYAGTLGTDDPRATSMVNETTIQAHGQHKFSFSVEKVAFRDMRPMSCGDAPTPVTRRTITFENDTTKHS